MGHSTLHHTPDLLYTDTYWDDLRVANTFKLGGGNDPSLQQFPTNCGFFYEFDSGEELGWNTQMPHKWKLGTDLHLHLHWTARQRSTEEAGNTVNWRVDLSAAGIGVAFPAATTYDLTDTVIGSDDDHLVVEATAVVPGAALTLSSILSGRVYRLAGDSFTGGNNVDPLLLELDLHHQIDRPGSREEYTK
jgi:hypothetical protein